MINIIVAIARNYAIGKGNQLLWHIPEDLKHFKALTLNSAVVMGRKTFESIGRPLPHRRNIVVSRTMEKREGIEISASIEEALELLNAEQNVFVIGGGEIYKQVLEMGVVDRLYLTVVDEDFSADTFFPKIDFNKWNLVDEMLDLQSNTSPYRFAFKTYEKAKPNI